MEKTYLHIFDDYSATFNQRENTQIVNINTYNRKNPDYEEQVKLFLESFSEDIFESKIEQFLFQEEEEDKVKNDFFNKVFDIVFEIRAGDFYSVHKEIFSKIISSAIDEKLDNRSGSNKYTFVSEISKYLVKKDNEYLFDPFIVFFQENSTYIRTDYKINIFKILSGQDLMNINLESVSYNGFKESVIFQTLLEDVSFHNNEKRTNIESISYFLKKGWSFPKNSALEVILSHNVIFIDFIIKNNLVDINAGCEVSYEEDGENFIVENIIDCYKSTSKYAKLNSIEKTKTNKILAILFDNALRLDLMYQSDCTPLAHLTDEILDNMRVNIFEEYNSVFNHQQDYTGNDTNVHINALDYFIGESQIKTAKTLYNNQKDNILKQKEDILRLIEKSLLIFQDDNVNIILMTPMSKNEIMERNDFAVIIFNDYKGLFSEIEKERLLNETLKSPILLDFNSIVEREIISNNKSIINGDFKNKINRL